MSNKFDPSLVTQLHDLLEKAAFSPASGMGGAPPMPPAGGGGAPPMPPAGGGAPPMDPAMMGGAPPMDPAMMGGAPPMDPAMMDPAMMGGAPPEGGAPPGEAITVGLEDLLTLFSQIAAEQGGGGGAPNEASPDMSKALDDITKRLESIESKLGGGEPPTPEGAAGAELPPEGGEGLPSDPEGMEAMLAELQGMDPSMMMGAMGAGATPGMDATAAPMPQGMPIAASSEETMKKASNARTIGDLVASLRKDSK